MKNTIVPALAALILGATFVPSQASAGIEYNQDITAIFGDGNPNNNWTTSTEGSIQLALRAKFVVVGSPTVPSSNEVYFVPTGQTLGKANWNFEFSLNSDLNTGNLKLNEYTFQLLVDIDPTAGVNYLTYDPIGQLPDNSYGNNSTMNGQGVEGTGATYASTYNIAQNSESSSFAFAGGNSGLTDATFDYVLKAFDGDGNLLAQDHITVVQGAGGAAVPEPSIFALGLIGLGGLLASRRFRRTT